MAIYGEPKDGDFVRYIETLNRQAGGTPGQVMPSKRSGILEDEQKSTFGQKENGESIYTYKAPSDPAAPGYPSNISPGSTENDSQQPTSLATRTSHRRLALALAIGAAIALWNAIHRLITAINTDTLDLDTMVPIAFLIVCAWMLFKGSQGARRKQNQPLAKLSPLSMVKMGRAPKN